MRMTRAGMVPGVQLTSPHTSPRDTSRPSRGRHRARKQLPTHSAHLSKQPPANLKNFKKFVKRCAHIILERDWIVRMRLFTRIKKKFTKFVKTSRYRFRNGAHNPFRFTGTSIFFIYRIYLKLWVNKQMFNPFQ